ncbi:MULTISPECIES: alpha/beta hydrolase [unclassified Leptolyngbya]|uniref:alpha/beta fold hydrolase n=1 Tax=unclassified Leptolyngbya TaxID=2650499 RepID=UPI0016839AD5|nr:MULTISPECIES: alpha/beta hydrolase [unclassified Leptolyngbya]MBD1912283.1 alpha/beta hydrolase [Leptolyngbya sp. FACHB-8]MBD2153852.1 alpha/beta hydrolase [Leptolyngbya sp. FACHB-16]
MVSTVEVLGVPHAYELTSPAKTPPVLVFVHGWLLSRAYWQPLIQQLSPYYQCLTYDLRGFGDSQTSRQVRVARLSPAAQVAASPSRPSSPATLPLEQGVSTETLNTEISSGRYTPADYAHDLEILLEKLNLSNVWLVGHSLGGSISLWAADQMGDRVKGVICVNSGGGIYLKEEFERFRAAGEQLVRLRPRWLCYLPLLDRMMAWMNVARPLPRSWGRRRLVDWTAADPEAALGALLDSTTEEEVHRLPQVVSRLKQPVYFLTGQQDTVMEPQYVQHLASFHSLFHNNANNVIEIPDCGHLAMLEQTDYVSQIILDILQKHSDSLPTSA